MYYDSNRPSIRHDNIMSMNSPAMQKLNKVDHEVSLGLYEACIL